MNLLQNLHLVVIEYLYYGRRAVPLQTFTTRHSRKLSIVNHFYTVFPVNYQIRQNNAK